MNPSCSEFYWHNAETPLSDILIDVQEFTWLMVCYIWVTEVQNYKVISVGLPLTGLLESESIKSWTCFETVMK